MWGDSKAQGSKEMVGNGVSLQRGSLSARGSQCCDTWGCVPAAVPDPGWHSAPRPRPRRSSSWWSSPRGCRSSSQGSEELQCLQDELRRLQEDTACNAQVQQLAQLERHSCLGPEVEELK